MKKLFIKTYGCQMNFYDSDKIGNLLKNLGYAFTNDLKEANLIVLNTCHIRDKAVEKTFSDLGRIKKTIETKENYVQKPIIVLAGCVAQAQGEEIMKSVGSFLIVELMRQGYHPQDACKEANNRIIKKYSKIDFQVAFIALRKDGEFGTSAIQNDFSYILSSKSNTTINPVAGLI